MLFSRSSAMVCIDCLLERCGSTQRLTTLQTNFRFWLQTLVGFGSTSLPISSGRSRYLVACKKVEILSEQLKAVCKCTDSE